MRRAGSPGTPGALRPRRLLGPDDGSGGGQRWLRKVGGFVVHAVRRRAKTAPSNAVTVTRLPVAATSGARWPSDRSSAIFAVGNYDGAFRRAIVSYKYGYDLRWAPVFGRLLHGFLQRHATWFEEYGVICPVPSFIGQGARRPWGHTELVCAEVGRLAGAEWPVEALVTKVAETEPMSAKARPARRAIARTGLVTAFAVPQPAAAQGRHILVVDDVCAVRLDPAHGEQGADRRRR